MNDNYKLQFIDTNILVYAYNAAEPQKQQLAGALINELWESRLGHLSIQILQEFYVTVTQKIAHPLPPEVALPIVGDFGNWVVHSPTVEDLLDAIAIQQKYQLSFGDALMICSAKKLSCAIIWTEDLNNGQFYEGLQVCNPFLKN
jgi:Predicted nucleic-acid-binding protein, contains PIN domain